MSRDKAPLMMVRRGDALFPLDGLARDELVKLPERKPLKVRASGDRSNPQNRLYFAMLKLVVENMAQNTTKETLHEWLKLELDVVDLIKLRNGDIVKLPSSTAFDKMDAAQFNDYFRSAINIICNKIIIGLRREDLLREANLMLAGRPFAASEPSRTQNEMERA